MNTYLTMKSSHEKEFNAFPMVFAFSDKQFKEGMEKLGLKVTDTDKVYRSAAGGFYKKTDSPKLVELLNRHTNEMDEAIKADTTGEGFIFDMFDYELANHEYNYTYDDEDTLNSLSISQEDLNTKPAMAHGLKLAKAVQF